MSKWYKVDLPWHNYTGDDLYFIPDDVLAYVKNELQCEGRVKYKVFQTPWDDMSSWKWCFKFKDETAAVAFKLRWL